MTSRTQRSRSTSGPNFDRIAPIYRWAEYLALGPLLQRTRTQFLTDLLDRRHALILGDGDGRFLAELLRLSPSVQALALDISGSMLHHLRMRCLRRAPSSSFRLRTLQTSTLGFTPSNETDLVVTHFLLDCFTQPDVDALAERFATHLPPGALWLLSDFGVPRRKWQRPFAALYVRALYLASHTCQTRNARFKWRAFNCAAAQPGSAACFTLSSGSCR
jgi:ubiquinone/menaquinone biosynthesis C-methylase UbiE